MTDPGSAVVIEDDADVRNLVAVVLRQSGFEVHTAANGRDGVEAVQRYQPVVVTLDVGLPDIDGYEVLRRIRKGSDCYIVMLTARADELDALTGLQSGADDFLTKPFRPRELRARVAAMLRRPRGVVATAIASHSDPQVDGRLVHNGLTIDARARTVELGGREVVLTRTEFDLLLDVAANRGAVRTKADLVRAARAESQGNDTYISDADERAVEVHIGNLRRKLGEDARNPKWLQTVRGIGYRLAAKEES